MPMFLSSFFTEISLRSWTKYYKYLILGFLLQKLVKPEIFQLFFFLLINKTRLTNSTCLRNTCNSKHSRPTCAGRSRVNTGYQIFFRKIQKTVLRLSFVILYEFSYLAYIASNYPFILMRFSVFAWLFCIMLWPEAFPFFSSGFFFSLIWTHAPRNSFSKSITVKTGSDFFSIFASINWLNM